MHVCIASADDDSMATTYIVVATIDTLVLSSVDGCLYCYDDDDVDDDQCTQHLNAPRATDSNYHST